MKKIDAHLHVNFGNINFKNIIEYLDVNKFEKCWLLTWEELTLSIDSIYKSLTIEDVLYIYNKYPDRIVPFYAPDPKTKNLIEVFDKYIKLGIRGVGELKVGYKWEDDLIEEYLRIISSYNIPLLFHMELPRKHYVSQIDNKFEKIFEQLMNGALNGITRYYLYKIISKIPILSRQMEKKMKFFPGYLYDFIGLEDRLIQFPNLNFIAHGPHFWNNISNIFSNMYILQKGEIDEFGIIDKLLEHYSNLYCDISGKGAFNALNRDREKTKIFLEKHSNKIIFGTDNINYNLEALVLSLGLSSKTVLKIFYSNAEQIIKI